VTSEQVDQSLEPGAVQRRLGYLAEDVRRRLGPGARLGDDVRVAFEGRLGGDLSGVMVHRAPLAGRLARTLGAEALSVGEHIVGGHQTLDVSTVSGTAVLGHELSHVVQRTSSEAGEQHAQMVERAITDEAQAGATAAPSAPIDTEALTERVYQRMIDQLRLERDRAAWIP
jgi:hypothetical protein